MNLNRFNLYGKKILFVLPHKKFRDEEYKVPRDLFDAYGAKSIVACSSLELARGMLGMVVTPDVTVNEVDAKDYDAILLVGGVGSIEFWHRSVVHVILKQAYFAGKVVGAICLAPIILANAGILEGKRATAYPSAENHLKWKGAKYSWHAVEVEDNIITANGPEAAGKFSRAIAGMLNQKTKRTFKKVKWT